MKYVLYSTSIECSSLLMSSCKGAPQRSRPERSSQESQECNQRQRPHARGCGGLDARYAAPVELNNASDSMDTLHHSSSIMPPIRCAQVPTIVADWRHRSLPARAAMASTEGNDARHAAPGDTPLPPIEVLLYRRAGCTNGNDASLLEVLRRPSPW